MNEATNLINFELPGTTPVIEMACEVQAADMARPVKFKVLWDRLDREAHKELSEEMRNDGHQLMLTRRELQKYDAYGEALERGEVLDKFDDIDLSEKMAEMYGIVDELEEKRLNRVRQYFKGVKGFPAGGNKKIDVLPDDAENIEGLLGRMLEWDHYIEGLAGSLEKSTNTAKRNEAKAKN